MNTEKFIRKAMRTTTAGAIVILLLFALIANALLIPAAPTFADTSGPLNAGTGADVAGIGTVTWSNPGYVTADDTSYATASVPRGGGITHYLQATNYGFSIPSDATIDGILVTIGRYASGTGIRDYVVSLVKAGTVTGDNKAVTGTNWPTSAVTARNYGGSADLWGSTWTPADINASNFGVALSVRNNNATNARTARVDYIQITVTYHPTPTTLTVSTATGTYGGTASLTATLTRTAGGAAISGKTIDFTLNGVPAGSATTNATGVANIAAADLSGINPGVYPTGMGASFAGDAGYAASSGTASLTVNKATPAIIWANPADITYPTALSGTQLNADAGISGSYVYTPPSGTVLGAGNGQTLHVDFTPTDSANYSTAAKDVTINVLKASQTITFNPLPEKTEGDPDFDPGATASSGLPVSYSSSNTSVATIVSEYIHIVGVGTSMITASQAGNSNYSAATPVDQLLTVNSALTIDITAPDDISGWNLDPTLGENTNGGTLAVDVTPFDASWSVTAQDLDTANTNGFMTLWEGSSYNTSVKLANAMKVAGPAGEVTLPSGGAVATGTGDDPAISITFKQFVEWTDDPSTYQIVVTFIATAN